MIIGKQLLTQDAKARKHKVVPNEQIYCLIKLKEGNSVQVVTASELTHIRLNS